MKLKKAWLAGAALLAAAVAYAAPMYDYKTIYYSDASLTEEVGNGYFTCGGKTYVYGIKTDYAVNYDYNACRKGGYECPEGAPYCIGTGG